MSRRSKALAALTSVLLSGCSMQTVGTAERVTSEAMRDASHKMDEARQPLRPESLDSVRIEDGVKDELSVLVDGVPVLQRSTNYLPTIEEVEAAMQNAEPADRGVSSTGTVHHTDSWQSRPVDE